MGFIVGCGCSPSSRQEPEDNIYHIPEPEKRQPPVSIEILLFIWNRSEFRLSAFITLASSVCVHLWYNRPQYQCGEAPCMRPVLSVVVPIFDEEDVIPEM